MKYLLGLVLSLSSLNSYAAEIRVKRMHQDGELERSFVLSTNLPDKVVLDCQSFIQGLRIGEKENAIIYMLDPYECESVQERVRKSLRRLQNHCIDVEEDIRADYSC
ncbi:MAG: hypothetical protein NDI69_04060 [Bacteriovoracaceae bacterium]|nr:hypothetical protein [Bacteriovoracaceae bacterium]